MKSKFISIALSIILFSCSKSYPNTNSLLPGTSLQIFVNYGNNLIPNATVYLFTSQSEWDDFAYYGNDSYIATTTTNSNGVASFNVAATTFYWFAKDSCENSFNDSADTKKTLTANVVNGGNAALEETGEIVINNTNINSSINISINGIPAGSLIAGKSKSYPYLALGNYMITAYSSFDSTTQTANPNLLNCGNVQTINFNP